LATSESLCRALPGWREITEINAAAITSKALTSLDGSRVVASADGSRVVGFISPPPLPVETPIGGLRERKRGAFFRLICNRGASPQVMATVTKLNQ
jgi:hypothetical protein